MTLQQINFPTLRCTIEVFREGVLSAVGHDLLLEAQGASLSLNLPESLHASVDASTLRVVTARRDGKDLPDALSAGDRQKIETAIATEILSANRHPKIDLRCHHIAASGENWRLEGAFTIRGATRPFSALATQDGADYVVRFPLVQSDFGIKPYRALMGTLRVADRLNVAVRCPKASITA